MLRFIADLVCLPGRVRELVEIHRKQLKETRLMTEALDRLTASVTELVAVDQSAIALIGGLAEAIREGAEDADAMNALADKLDADKEALAAAVTANTPAAAPAPAEGGEQEQQEEQ